MLLPKKFPNWTHWRELCSTSCSLGNFLPQQRDKISHNVSFSPPYYSLEKYSDHPLDLSNQPTYEEFLRHYKQIIRDSVRKLEHNRFACFVVGNKDNWISFYCDLLILYQVASSWRDPKTGHLRVHMNLMKNSKNYRTCLEIQWELLKRLEWIYSAKEFW